MCVLINPAIGRRFRAGGAVATLLMTAGQPQELQRTLPGARRINFADESGGDGCGRATSRTKPGVVCVAAHERDRAPEVLLPKAPGYLLSTWDTSEKWPGANPGVLLSFVPQSTRLSSGRVSRFPFVAPCSVRRRTRLLTTKPAANEKAPRGEPGGA